MREGEAEAPVGQQHDTLVSCRGEPVYAQPPTSRRYGADWPVKAAWGSKGQYTMSLVARLRRTSPRARAADSQA